MISLADQIKAYLDSFPEGTRFNIKEIGAILNLTPDTIAARIHRDKDRYGKYLGRKQAGVGSTLEYRLDAEAIMEMVDNPKYRGQYSKTVNTPKSGLTTYSSSDDYDHAMLMIDRWKNEGEVPQELLERIEGMKYEFGTTWYPMESAPKDGTRIIVCSGDVEREIIIVEWKWSGYGKESDKKKWDWCIIYGYNDEAGTEWIVSNPIGWMPCPPSMKR